MFRHYRIILRELVVGTFPSYTSSLCQIQLLVTQFKLKIFHIGFMQVSLQFYILLTVHHVMILVK